MPDTLHGDLIFFNIVDSVRNIFVVRHQCKGRPVLYFHGNNRHGNVPKCYVLCALPILFIEKMQLIPIAQKALSARFLSYCLEGVMDVMCCQLFQHGRFELLFNM